MINVFKNLEDGAIITEDLLSAAIDEASRKEPIMNFDGFTFELPWVGSFNIDGRIWTKYEN